MKHSIISIALVILAVFSLSARDRLFIQDFRIRAGETVQVPVLLSNDTAYSGLQTDLYLPAGLTLDKRDGDGQYVIDLTARRDNSHTVASNLLASGAIRIYVTSASAKDFSGNSGAVLTLSLTAASDYVGPAVIELKNTVCAESIGTRHELDDEVCQVMNPILLGDVNGDGEVNVADINVVTDIVLGGTVDSQTRLRADVNGDGEINVADINVISDIILSK